MNKLLSGFFGALALCVVASTGQAAPAPNAPVAIAVFHPDDMASHVQTVQYNSHFRPHYRGRRGFSHRRGFPRHFAHRHAYQHRGPVIGAPYRRY